MRTVMGGTSKAARGLLLACALLSATLVHADVYMHNPRGSNDRNCERNVNRNNGNRLFDSQNNAKGGYACPRAVGGPEIETERMYYYVGSKIPIEWTNQHACGKDPKVKCEVVIQYACEETLDPSKKFRGGSTPTPYFLERPDTQYIGAPRDGTPVDANDAATFTIPDSFDSAKADTVASRRYGMQESYDYYKACKETKRNGGLFNADQNLRRRDLRATRQNPNGNRHGFECPSERDHYPYWHPNPWVDVAVLHNHASDESDPDFSTWCDYYRTNSQNYATSPVGECIAAPGSSTTTLRNRGEWYNNRASCEAAGHTWETRRFGMSNGTLPWGGVGIPPLECRILPASRINQLGNAEGTVYASEGLTTTETEWDTAAIPHGLNANRFVWTVPNTPSRACVLRIRYNITGLEAGGWAENAGKAGGPAAGTPGLNASFNGADNSPILQDPYVDIGDMPTDPTTDREFLSLAVNTNQYGRTFQDRSYVFEIRAPGTANQDSEDSDRVKAQDQAVATAIAGGAHLYNLNVRGKRGNIVQTFPAVEYDFIPNDLRVTVGDIVHVQWTGSDYNPRRGCNDGEGGPPDPYGNAAADQNSRADRNNLVEIDILSANYPLDGVPLSKLEGKSMFFTSAGALDTDTVMKMAFLGQEEELAMRRERCLTQEELEAIRNRAMRETNINNCAKINAPRTPYFDGGIVTLRGSGVYKYYSSRNSNFSNRRQSGRICVAVATTPSAMTSYCDARVQIVPNDVEVQTPPQFQADKPAAAAAILTDETFDAAPFAINDAAGDGELYDCEGMKFQLPNLTLGDVIIVVVVSALVGAAVTLTAQYAFAYLQTGVGPYDFFCRPAKPYEDPTKPVRAEELDVSPEAGGGSGSGDGADPLATAEAGAAPPRPTRRPILSWSTAKHTPAPLLAPETAAAPAAAPVPPPKPSTKPALGSTH